MIVLVLDEEEGQQVLDRLLSSQVPQQGAPVPAPKEDEAPAQQSVQGTPWSHGEDAAIIGCSSPLEARKEYRAAFPGLDRTNGAIKARFLALKKLLQGGESDAITADLRDECSAEQIEAETERSGEPAGPVDSVIAAEMGDPDPTDAPSPEQDLTIGTGPWVDHPEEDAAIVRAVTSAEALQVYRQAFPDSPRSDGAVKSRWYALQGTPSNNEHDPMLDRSAAVTILQPSSPYHGARGKIVRRNHRTREYLIAPDGSTSQIWLSEGYVQPLKGGRQ